jgi:hypothetical protein
MIVQFRPLISERCGETINLGQHLLDGAVGAVKVTLFGLFSDLGHGVGRQLTK